MAFPTRHDLVWLRPDLGGWSAVDADPVIVSDWIASQLPLVTARRGADFPRQWSLGFTPPSPHHRRRVSVLASPQAVQCWNPSPSLAEVMPVLPESWRPNLISLDVCLRSKGFDPGVFGSAVTLFFTGVPCLRADSDIDLLIDCRDHHQVAQVLDVLQSMPQPPRLDGELRFPSGWSVSWRELAAVWPEREARVLAKSDAMVALLKVHELGLWP